MRTPKFFQKRPKQVSNSYGINPALPPVEPVLVDHTRDLVATMETDIVANDIRDPRTPITCSGTSFECNVEGSGKDPIKDVPTHPTESDYIATEIQEAGISGVSFQPDIILNWNNNSIATGYTKCSLKNTYGFENFQ